MEEKLEHLKFLIKKETFVNRWKKRALRYMLSDIAPRLTNELDYYLIEEYYQIIKQLNEPFQPCMNHYDAYNKMYASLIITYVRVIKLIRKVLYDSKTTRDYIKKYSIQERIGKARYVINFHNGIKKNKDNSPFYDIKIFKNKKDLKLFEQNLLKEGYKEVSHGE